MGIRPVVFGLLVSTSYTVIKSNVTELKSFFIFIVSFISLYKNFWILLEY
ncbi:hypothetical protein PL321_18880 [Caloramator sp. mosi_1]|nr:hypothetical protein [Caloramator sp. mosi_1]WDC84250.1 hypothetical protein PL321_18880 [Caloramator sp. mosi_1]